jgi:pyruvate/2-oxoglutarate dehydrogenase complex dihydrolipoamide dehydrogenase (E3) component
MKVVPWCTFSDPEVASVGLREQEAVTRFGKERVSVLKYGLDDFDRAIIDDVATGFVKVSILKNGTILGASIVADRAGEMIHEFAIAMKKGMKIQELAGIMHVYPTMSASIGNAAAQYYKQLAANGWQSKLLRMWVDLHK